MACAVAEFSIARDDRDRVQLSIYSGGVELRGVRDLLDPSNDPVVSGRGEADVKLAFVFNRFVLAVGRLVYARRVLARAIEHDPECTVGMREAPGDFDQPLAHLARPESLA